MTKDDANAIMFAYRYASQYLELQEGLKIVVVQPGIIERNGELVILDKNLKAD